MPPPINSHPLKDVRAPLNWKTSINGYFAHGFDSGRISQRQTLPRGEDLLS